MIEMTALMFNSIMVYQSFSEIFSSYEFPINSNGNWENIGWELAGKDSVAACLKFIKESESKHIRILPLAILHSGFTGSLWNVEKIKSNYSYLKSLASTDNIRFLNPVVLDASIPFNKIILRTMGMVQQKYTAFTPCVPCHLYLHLFRIPILKHYSIEKLITGERIRHNHRIKLNQLPEILGFYQTKVKELGIQLIQPLKNVIENQLIDEIINEFKMSYFLKNATDFKHEIIQDECIFSKNSEDENGNPVFNQSTFLRQLEEFYFPKIQHYLGQILN
jgi:hypothetical protein